ncbi:MAG: hypothetical protein RLZ04_961 [Actinomycetota bacterium]|jgi:uncharacterized protein (DUF58 family)
MLTRQGWAALASGASLLVAGRLFGLIELYVLGAGTAALVIVSLTLVLARRRSLHHVETRRSASPPVVAVGEIGQVSLVVSRPGGRRGRLPRIDLWEDVDEGEGVAAGIAHLAPGDDVRTSYVLPTTRRGRRVLGPATLTVTDPLGLASTTRTVPGTLEVLVIPRRVPLVFPRLASAGRIGQVLRERAWGATGGEFHSQREYVPGDDLRRINWKASARTGDLMVRETTPDGARRCTIVLDGTMQVTDPDAFERAVSVAASVLSAAAAEGIECRFVARDADFRGPTTERDTLVWLATASGDRRPVEPAATGRLTSDGLGLVVVVAASPAAETVSATARSVGHDDVLLVVATSSDEAAARAAAPGRSIVVRATDLESMALAWNQLVDGER